MKTKRLYRKPALRVVKIQHHTHMLAGSNPAVNNEVSTKPSYSRAWRDWQDDMDE